jgi:peptidoglycan/LPS O-acetylase OafA/YrhL
MVELTINNQKSPRSFVGPLTSIRGLFALMVVWTHFSGYHHIQHWTTPLGGVAVGWFFILSGFILAYNYPSLPTLRHQLSFLVSRFWRMWPVQAVTIVVSLILFPSGLYIVQHQTGYFIQSITLTHAWTAVPYASQLFNTPAWSISVEWFFYLLFPILIVMSWPVRIAIASFAALLALGLVGSYGCWNSLANFTNPGDSYHATCFQLLTYWPPIRIWEFVLGIAICECSNRIGRKQYSENLQIPIILAAFVMLLGYFEVARNFPPGFLVVHFAKWGMIAYFAKWGLATACGSLLILGLSLRGPATKPLSMRPLLFRGEISFSVYMIHFIIMRFVDEHQIWLNLRHGIQFVLQCAVIVLVASLINVFVEKPSRRALKNIQYRW